MKRKPSRALSRAADGNGSQLSLPKTGTPSNRDPFLMRTDVYQIAARAQPAQNGLTITRMTIAIISRVGISLTMRQWRGGLSFLSSLNARTEAEK